VKVSEISSKPVVSVNRDVDLLDVATIMGKHNIARVFVCDEKRIVGLVSLFDVLSAALIERARKGYAS
jgi:CBS domain-containing protein